MIMIFTHIFLIFLFFIVSVSTTHFYNKKEKTKKTFFYKNNNNTHRNITCINIVFIHLAGTEIADYIYHYH